jgi:uncharacterized protein (DUF1697 family)
MTIAFLRGINVGGHNVKKEVLCQVLVELDLTGVRTFIASGNLIFDAHDRAGRSDAAADADLEERIATALEKTLGWPVPTFVRSPAEVAAIVGFADAHPELAAGDGQTLQVGLTHRAPAKAAAAALEALSTPADLLRVHGREIYWLTRGPVHKSKLTSPRLDRTAGGPATFRNITTMRRLVDLVGA